MNEFYDMVSSLQGKDEVRLFFADLLTLDEIAMLMRRIEVAALLRAGFSYEQITDVLGVGRNKITNVQHSLQRKESGYDIVIQKLLRSGRTSKKPSKSRNGEFERLKRMPYSGLYIFQIIDEIGGLLESKFKNKLSKENKEILSRMPTRRI